MAVAIGKWTVDYGKWTAEDRSRLTDPVGALVSSLPNISEDRWKVIDDGRVVVVVEYVDNCEIVNANQQEID